MKQFLVLAITLLSLNLSASDCLINESSASQVSELLAEISSDNYTVISNQITKILSADSCIEYNFDTVDIYNLSDLIIARMPNDLEEINQAIEDYINGDFQF